MPSSADFASSANDFASWFSSNSADCGTRLGCNRTRERQTLVGKVTKQLLSAKYIRNTILRRWRSSYAAEDIVFENCMHSCPSLLGTGYRGTGLREDHSSSDPQLRPSVHLMISFSRFHRALSLVLVWMILSDCIPIPGDKLRRFQ